MALTYYSDQRTNERAHPPTMNPVYDGGKMRRMFFSITTGAVAAIGDDYELLVIPKNSRIVGGFIAWEALTSGGAAATGSIGITGAVAKYLAATSMDSVGSADFAKTIALNYGELLSAAATLLLTNSVEAFATGKLIYGHVDILGL